MPGGSSSCFCFELKSCYSITDWKTLSRDLAQMLALERDLRKAFITWRSAEDTITFYSFVVDKIRAGWALESMKSN